MKKFNYLTLGNTGFIKEFANFLKQKKQKVIGFGSKKLIYYHLESQKNEKVYK